MAINQKKKESGLKRSIHVTLMLVSLRIQVQQNMMILFK